MKRKGFTIVELLMVIAIISVLITITVSAVSGAFQRARIQKANALCTLVEQGIATYYAQVGEWPVEPTLKNNESTYTYSSQEVDEIVTKLVKQTQKGSPVMDVSGLFVARSGGSGKKYGMDFTSAVKGTKRNPEGIRLAKMTFGYPVEKDGTFHQFTIVYDSATDKISVSK